MIWHTKWLIKKVSISYPFPLGSLTGVSQVYTSSILCRNMLCAFGLSSSWLSIAKTRSYMHFIDFLPPYHQNTSYSTGENSIFTIVPIRLLDHATSTDWKDLSQRLQLTQIFLTSFMNGSWFTMAGSEPLIQDSDPPIRKFNVELKIVDKDGPNK